MTSDEWAYALSVIDGGAMVATGLGGFLFGALILWQTPVLRDGGVAGAYVGFVFGFFGLIFFLARGVDLFFDRNPLWPRSVGFIVLWELYSGCTVLGLAMRRRLAQ